MCYTWAFAEICKIQKNSGGGQKVEKMLFCEKTYAKYCLC